MLLFISRFFFLSLCPSIITNKYTLTASLPLHIHTLVSTRRSTHLQLLPSLHPHTYNPPPPPPPCTHSTIHTSAPASPHLQPRPSPHLHSHTRTHSHAPGGISMRGGAASWYITNGMSELLMAALFPPFWPNCRKRERRRNFAPAENNDDQTTLLAARSLTFISSWFLSRRGLWVCGC